MITKRQTPITAWALGLLTIGVLLVNLPQNLSAVLGTWLLFVGLTAFSLNAGILLTHGEIQVAHLFGMMAFLVLAGDGDQARADALWAVAAGSLLGGLIRAARSDQWLPRRRVSVRSLETIAEMLAQQTLSLFIASTVYITVGGRLPLGQLGPVDIGPLAAYLVVYLLLYLLLFVLRVRLEGIPFTEIFAENLPVLLAALLLPGPFAILGAVAVTELDPLSRALMFTGMILMVAGVNGLSRIQYRTQQQVDELTSLSVVSRTLRSSLELDLLLDTIYLQVASLLAVDNFTVALLDASRNEIRFPLAYQRGARVELPPQPPGKDLLGHVIRHSAPLRLERGVAERAHAMQLAPPAGPVYSWLGVPVVSAERTLGAIVIYSSNPEQLLGPADERLLLNIAGQAGVAMENATLFQQAQERVHQIAALNNIAALLTGTLQLEKVLNLIPSAAAAISEGDGVALYVYEGFGEARLARVTGMSQAFASAPPQPLIVEQARRLDPDRLGRQPVVIQNTAYDDLTPEWQRIAEREEKRAWMEWLLVVGDMPVGVLCVFYTWPREFTGEQLELLRNFATQAALAWNNARRYNTIDVALERRVQHLQILFEISQELSAILDVQPIIEMALERAIEGTGSHAGLLALGAEDSVSGIRVVASTGYDPALLENPLRLKDTVPAIVYDTAIPQLLNTIHDQHEYAQLDPAMQSQLSVPVMREGLTLGVIALESRHANAYNDDDINFLINLTTYTAIVIYNAQLFRTVRQGRDRLRVILDSMTDGVLLITRNGWVEMANPRIEALIGAPPGGLQNRLVDDLVNDTESYFAYNLGFTIGDLRVLLADLRAGELDPESLAPYSYELFDPQPHHMYLRRQLVPVHDTGGDLLGLLLVLVDETEEQELARTREDLSRMIVHDLRSPLTAVTASLKLIKDIIPQESEYRPIVERTTDASNRAIRKLLNLVDSLLDIAKMESGQMVLDREPTHIQAVATNVVLEMDSLAQELDVNISTNLDYDLPLLDVDDEKIERVLLNLVDNALKFTPTGGKVEITAAPQQENGKMPVLRVSVKDSGPGVPDEYKERLFNRFVQVEGLQGRRRGTGLGLTFCRLAVEAHGGRIWVEDNPTGGAMFSFTVPVIVMPEHAPDETQPRYAEDDLSAPLL